MNGLGNAFADNCLRGIRNPAQIWEDGFVQPDVFRFDHRAPRPDGCLELSINWEDDESVVAFTLAQKTSEQTPLYRGGVAVVARIDLDRLSKRSMCADALSYNRQDEPDNPYHGNLVLAAGVSQQLRKHIEHALAVHVSHVVPQPL